MNQFKIVTLFILALSSGFVDAQSTTSVSNQGIVDPHRGRKGLVPAGVKAVINGRVFTTKAGEINLAGVEVRIKGTKLSTTTSSGGNFSLDITTICDNKDEITVICEVKNYSTVDTIVKKPFPRATHLKIEMIPKGK